MIHAIPISGGKDSQATAIYFLKEVYPTLNPVSDSAILIFCDTGNEADVTYKFLFEFSALFPPEIPLKILKNKRGETLFEQAKRKKRFPSLKAKFCSVELKVEPMIDWVITLNDDVRIYDGRRREESPSRSKLSPREDYFEDYIDPPKKAKLYRRKAVQNWIERHEAIKIHPVLTWGTKQVFEYISENGYLRNPLYDLGLNRVGCFPCINCSLGEIIRVDNLDPDKIQKIEDIEIETGHTFFAPDKIPFKFCKKKITNSEGKVVGIPTMREVINYAKDRRHDDGLFKGTCLNKYVQCE